MVLSVSSLLPSFADVPVIVMCLILVKIRKQHINNADCEKYTQKVGHSISQLTGTFISVNVMEDKKYGGERAGVLSQMIERKGDSCPLGLSLGLRVVSLKGKFFCKIGKIYI